MPRVLLLLPTTTYRTKAYLDAALKLGVEVVAASEISSSLENRNPENLLTLDFFHPEKAAAQAAEYARRFPIDAVIPVDEDTAVVSGFIAQALGLQHNSIASVQRAKNKHLMRETLRQAGVRVPRFWPFTLDDDVAEMARRIEYPCVLKPVFLSTSRGVMRADNHTELVQAFHRLENILRLPHIAKKGGAAQREILIEAFIPGFEVAVEGLLTEGTLNPLAIFDKPDPLDGPFFEETIYVTPSRLSATVQQEIIAMVQAATRAMGLTKGAIHAELRINDAGAWVIEVAARAIGGLCSRALRFGDEKISLEELILRQALGQEVLPCNRETLAAGAMMIPIPRAGILREVRGVEEARQVAAVEDVLITAHLTQELLPPPEGASYLGFIFSRAATPQLAEAALREAHRKIEFVIE
ncbi:MAG: ATP-grasp domain-containing protein [Acidobacteria bacterium]|nr:ATP-grasp domain-containing protein [Acidobacteriota bacterium]